MPSILSTTAEYNDGNILHILEVVISVAMQAVGSLIIALKKRTVSLFENKSKRI